MIIEGRIYVNDEYDTVCIEDEPIGDRWQWSDFDGRIIRLRYFVSNEPIPTIEDAEERFVRTLYGGCSSEAYGVFGSEWTGQYGFEQEFVVGGHDLVEELRTHAGKYVLIEIKVDE